jgi:hypothetical protein
MLTGQFQASLALVLLVSSVAGLQEAPIKDFTGTETRESLGTWFEACAAASCGCGLPPELLKDVPYVALNVQNTGISDDALARPLPAPAGAAQLGMFDNGGNCGRWVEITFLENCVGHGHDAQTDPPSICGVNPYEEDPLVNYEQVSWPGCSSVCGVQAARSVHERPKQPCGPCSGPCQRFSRCHCSTLMHNLLSKSTALGVSVTHAVCRMNTQATKLWLWWLTPARMATTGEISSPSLQLMIVVASLLPAAVCHATATYCVACDHTGCMQVPQCRHAP